MSDTEVALFHLLADIRAAAGDPEGKLMQDELVEHIRGLAGRVRGLEDRLFRRGGMKQAPCFVCGYNGPGYWQPDVHPCAARHHELFEKE